MAIAVLSSFRSKDPNRQASACPPQEASSGELYETWCTWWARAYVPLLEIFAARGDSVYSKDSMWPCRLEETRTHALFFCSSREIYSSHLQFHYAWRIVSYANTPFYVSCFSLRTGRVSLNTGPLSLPQTRLSIFICFLI